MQAVSEETIKKAAKGDMAAFEEVYRQSSGYVYSVAYRVMGNKHDAEEVTQDVFVKVYRKLMTFNFRSAFSTWLYRIAMNTAINKYRKRAKERGKNIPFNDDMGNEGGCDESAILAGLEKEDNEKLVQSMLDILPAGQRACVVLRNVEGLKYEQIASVLGINLNTVRSRLSRAREALVSIYGKNRREHEV